VSLALATLLVMVVTGLALLLGGWGRAIDSADRAVQAGTGAGLGLSAIATSSLLFVYASGYTYLFFVPIAVVTCPACAIVVLGVWGAVRRRGSNGRPDAPPRN
jgi:hypothetical protein